jgi:hypothetical protein
MPKWYVIAIDWQRPNVISEWDNEEDAKRSADNLDALALRCIAVQDGHPLLLKEQA